MTKVWRCTDSTCNIEIKEVDIGERYKKMVLTHLVMHRPVGSDICRACKSSYKKGQKLGKKNAENTPECDEERCRVWNKPSHYARACPMRCNLKGCNRGRWHKLTKEHMTKVMNKKKSDGNRRSGQKEKGASVNQVDGD